MSSPGTPLPPSDQCADLNSIVAAFAVLSGRYAAELQAAASEHGLSPQMAVALLHLSRMGETRMSEFARTMACDAGNLSGTIDRLEEADLVVRTASSLDKRVRILRSTPEGRRVATKIKRDLDATRVVAALRHLDDRERHALRDTLERLCGAGYDAAAGA